MLMKSLMQKMMIFFQEIQRLLNFSYISVPKPVGRIDHSSFERVKWFWSQETEAFLAPGIAPAHPRRSAVARHWLVLFLNTTV